MPQTVQQAISAARIILDDDSYRLIYLPPRGITAAAGVIAEVSEPFCALIVDQQEITLVLEQEAYEEYRHRLLDHRAESAIYRLITFDVTLEPTLTGFMLPLPLRWQNAASPSCHLLPSVAITCSSQNRIALLLWLPYNRCRPR